MKSPIEEIEEIVDGLDLDHVNKQVALVLLDKLRMVIKNSQSVATKAIQSSGSIEEGGRK